MFAFDLLKLAKETETRTPAFFRSYFARFLLISILLTESINFFIKTTLLYNCQLLRQVLAMIMLSAVYHFTFLITEFKVDRSECKALFLTQDLYDLLKGIRLAIDFKKAHLVLLRITWTCLPFLQLCCMLSLNITQCKNNANIFPFLITLKNYRLFYYISILNLGVERSNGFIQLFLF